MSPKEMDEAVARAAYERGWRDAIDAAAKAIEGELCVHLFSEVDVTMTQDGMRRYHAAKIRDLCTASQAAASGAPMSGAPWPEGVEQVVDLLERISTLGKQSSDLEAQIARGKELREEQHAAYEEVQRLISKMDLAYAGNRGFEVRMTMFLMLMRKRAEATANKPAGEWVEKAKYESLETKHAELMKAAVDEGAKLMHERNEAREHAVRLGADLSTLKAELNGAQQVASARRMECDAAQKELEKVTAELNEYKTALKHAAARVLRDAARHFREHEHHVTGAIGTDNVEVPFGDAAADVLDALAAMEERK